MDASPIEFGIDSFGDLPRNDRGAIVSHAEAIRAAVAEAFLADEAGIEVVALGGHHLPEFAISSPETVLAGFATVTKRIRLASGVTVLSSDEPVGCSSGSPRSTRCPADGQRARSPLAPARRGVPGGRRRLL
ncbi:LLM class flavin-dependent oxidoreductase [Streptomyces sp. MCL20-2]|uniref:LLM class flavin-dependent oxidoreductase n=1 Tax=Streptomyces sp. MCL20-2 TaxID=2967219 RepID=UPI00296707CF|nr:LLM class flavin-dependent oxidoreductase [Streptomyces sp. MCL20-2]